MDSGLGSDDEKRSRTKAQKQLQNEQKQLFSGCFIDATSLGDEGEGEGEFEHRRNDERRQGALIFRSSIPQYSMLQMPHVGTQTEQDTACGVQEEKMHLESTEITTPHNSIVQLDTEITKKTPVGFFVDLGNVEVAEVTPAPPVEKKNIFSMTIDFNVPKREMPSRLSTSLYGRKKKNLSTKSVFSSSTSLCEGTSTSCENETLSDSCSEYQSSLPTTEELDNHVDSKDDHDLNENDKNTEVNIKDVEVHNQKDISTAEKTKEETNSTAPPIQQYVKLSDLEEQSPRIDLFLAPRMSRSIPEKSWVESPLATFHSASYRSSPRPFHLDLNEPTETVSLTDSSGSLPPRRSAQRLGTDLLRMFLEEIGPDVTIEVNGRRLRAHKCILSSRCQYFAAVLGGNSTEDIVSIQGYSYAAVHFALCHIYSGAAHIPQSISLVELAALSDMLGLEGLKEVVTHALKVRHCHHFHKPCSGCLNGVVEVLPLSATYGLDELYQACLSWITKYFIEVWPTRTFAKLPRELRDKCYQQHVVHMAPETVLETTRTCDKLLATMPTAKWAEPVAQLTLQLADHCQVYLRQHYAGVLASPNFLTLNEEGNSIGQLEESLVSAAGALKLDQACHSYITCHKMLQKTLSTPFLDMLRKIYTQIENCVVRQVGQASRSSVWMQLEPSLRRRIRDLSATTSRQSQTYSKTKTESTHLPSSSSDSSRNSSPAISNMNRSQVQSPSLRRSLLMAARSSQAPTSPSTCRRTSTLTNPTQSSAAKSIPKSVTTSQRATTYNRTVTSSRNVTQRLAASREETKRTTTTRYTAQKENQIKRTVIPVSKNLPKKTDVSGSPTKVGTKKSSSASNITAIKRHPAAPKQVSSPKQSTDKSKPNDKPEKQSPTVRRSGTFLKEEPTVLGKM